MPGSNMDINKADLELCNFARLLALPIRVYIFKALIANNNILSQEVLLSLPFNPGQLTKHITDLKKAGFVTIRRENRKIRYELKTSDIKRPARQLADLFKIIGSYAPIEPLNPNTVASGKESLPPAALSFGRLIKKYRTTLKFSQDYLSAELGMNRSELSRIESDKKDFPPGKLQLLALALSVEYDVLKKQFYSFKIVEMVDKSGFDEAVLKNVSHVLQAGIPVPENFPTKRATR
ncbi:helix-turn-helix domain-containing protein [Mucilaginibacter sp. Mucisp84]|uniref:helix-turn-helix domain-containing protein n=1 Tax=Mucilaginibacter sp. Mucisp84 TaxID=3243058 RepID=UPI0039A6CEBF